MWGAIAGDIIGSVYEGRPIKDTDFPLFQCASCFTDDTVLTVATAEVLLDGGDYREAYQRYFARYPGAGFGGFFMQWAAAGETEPYYSFGNGSAMRVSPVGWAFNSLDEVVKEAERSAAVTHNHPEGIKGAQAVAAAVFLARTGNTRETLRISLEDLFEYDLARRLDAIRPGYHFDVTCQGSVPESIIAFLESSDFESAVRNAISLGGDADTQAAMAGAVAEAFYGGVPAAIRRPVEQRLDVPLLNIVNRFVEHVVR
jgi:ADP-ribosylglycohydrolase